MISLKIKTLDSQDHDFTVDDDITVRAFKEHIVEKTGIAANLQRLIYCGRVLNDEKPLNEYNVNGKVVHLVERAPPRTRPPGAGDAAADGSNGSNGGGGAGARRNGSGAGGVGGQDNRSQFFRALDGMVMGSIGIPVGPQAAVPLNPTSHLCMNRITVARHMLNCANNIVTYLDNPDAGLQNIDMDILSRQTYESTVLEVGISAVSHGEVPPREMQHIVQAFQGAVRDAFRQHGMPNPAAVPAAAGQPDGAAPAAPAVTAAPPAADGIAAAAAQVAQQILGGGGIGGQFQGLPFVIGSSVNVVPMDTSAAPTGGTEAAAATVAAPTVAPGAGETSPGAAGTSPADQSSSPVAASTPAVGASPEQMASSQSTSTSSGSGSSGSSPVRSSTTTSPTVLAEVVQQMRTVQERMAPYLQQYYDILANEPRFADNEARETSQRVYDRISEALHYMSHAQHAISDLMLDLSQTPARHLNCRPILIDQSGYLPVQRGVGTLYATNFWAPQMQPPAANAAAAAGNNAAAAGEPNANNDPGYNIAQELQNAIQQATQNAMAGAAQPPAAAPQPGARRPAAPAAAPAPGAQAGAQPGAQAGGQQPGGQQPGGQQPGADTLANFIQNILQTVTMYSDFHVDVDVNLSTDPPPAAGAGPGAANATESHNSSHNSSGSSTPTSRPAANAPATAPAPATATARPTAPRAAAAAAPAPGQPPRGATAAATTHPTTATQTRSTARPHVQMHTMQPGLLPRGFRPLPPPASTFDRFLPCNSHHVRENREAESMAGHQQMQAAAAAAGPAPPLRRPAGAAASGLQQQQPGGAAQHAAAGAAAMAAAAAHHHHHHHHAHQHQHGAHHLHYHRAGPGHAPQQAPPGAVRTFRLEHMPGRADIFYTQHDNMLEDLDEESLNRPIRLFGTTVTIEELRNFLPSVVTIQRIRGDLQAYVRRTFGVQPADGDSSGVPETAMNEVLARLQALVRGSPVDNTVLENTIFQTVGSVRTLMALVVPSAVELILDDNSEHFGERLRRSMADFVRRFIGVCVMCAGQNLTRVFMSDMVEMVLAEGNDIHDPAVQALMNHLFAAIDDAVHDDITPLSEIRELLTLQLGQPMDTDEQPPTTTAPRRPTATAAELAAASVIAATRAASAAAAATRSQPTSAAAAAAAAASHLPPTLAPAAAVIQLPPLASALPIPAPLPVDAADAMPVVLPGTESWHADIPNAWLPVIARDLGRQRRNGSAQPPYSDAYLSGMSSKRRKVISQAKPTGGGADPRSLLSDGIQSVLKAQQTASAAHPATNGLAASGSSAINGGTGAAATAFASTVAAVNEAVAANGHIYEPQGSYEQSMRSMVRSRVQADDDFCADRYPNIAKWIGGGGSGGSGSGGAGTGGDKAAK